MSLKTHNLVRNLRSRTFRQMLYSLFDMFDPCTSLHWRINWLAICLALIFLPCGYFYIPSLFNFFILVGIKYIYIELDLLLKCGFSGLCFVSLFFILFSYNFIGLFPYVFTVTSHITFTLRLALPFWLGFILFGWYNYSLHIFGHLVPIRTPPILIVFIVIIESIRLIIRPVTLAVRLCANIIAGHLLLCLIGSLGVTVGYFLVRFVLIVQIGLFLLEVGVSLIQAYVFTVLTSLYSVEVVIKNNSRESQVLYINI